MKADPVPQPASWEPRRGHTLVLSPLGANAAGGVDGRVLAPGLRPGAAVGQALVRRAAARMARTGRLTLTLDDHGLHWSGVRAEHRAAWADVVSVEQHALSGLGERGMNRGVVVTAREGSGTPTIAVDGQHLPFGPAGERLVAVVTAWWVAFR